MKRFLQAPKSEIKCVTLLAILILFVAACAGHRRENSAAPHPHYSSSRPTRLLVGQSDEFTVNSTNCLIVRDADFIRNLFATLSEPATNSFKHYLLVAPFAFIFVDDQGEVCGAFRYSISSQPDCVFWPCIAERQGHDYVITAGIPRMGIIVPGFTDRFRTYRDLTKF